MGILSDIGNVMGGAMSGAGLGWMEKLKQDAIKERDENLARMTEERDKRDREFRSAETAAEREFRSGETEKERTFRKDEFDRDIEEKKRLARDLLSADWENKKKIASELSGGDETLANELLRMIELNQRPGDLETKKADAYSAFMKMLLGGMPYDPVDPGHVKLSNTAKDLVGEFFPARPGTGPGSPLDRLLEEAKKKREEEKAAKPTPGSEERRRNIIEKERDVRIPRMDEYLRKKGIEWEEEYIRKKAIELEKGLGKKSSLPPVPKSGRGILTIPPVG